MEYKKQAHAVYYTRYHIVVSTKYRRKIFRGGVGEYLKKIIYDVSKVHPDVEIIEVNTDMDHVHFLVPYRPNIQSVNWLEKLKPTPDVK